jgi:hypothetical protein
MAVPSSPAHDRFRPLTSRSRGHVRFRQYERLLLRKAAVRFTGRDREVLTQNGLSPD